MNINQSFGNDGHYAMAWSKESLKVKGTCGKSHVAPLTWLLGCCGSISTWMFDARLDLHVPPGRGRGIEGQCIHCKHQLGAQLHR